MKNFVRKISRNFIVILFPQLRDILDEKLQTEQFVSKKNNVELGKQVRVYSVYKLKNCQVGDYTYIAGGAQINNAEIGKFCSIGPDFKCGWGVHPINGLSTHPMFYSTLKKNNITLAKVQKIEEVKKITIGNDVFIGRGVIVLDGVSIGTGAVIGAGSVVSKDIPDYAIAVGCPIKIIKYRFSEEQRDKLDKIKWWNFPEERLGDVEKYFFEIESFIEKYTSKEWL